MFTQKGKELKIKNFKIKNIVLLRDIYYNSTIVHCF